MITIKDMADLAGVSPTTVTNVLHGRTKKMSKETLQKVQAVIDSSDYVSNMGARLLANYGSKIIGVILNYDRRGESNIISDPFYGTVVGSLEKEIREHGYYMMLYTAGNIEETVRLAKSWNIEGLIALGCKPSDARKMKEQMDLPVVFIDSYFEDKDYEYHNVGLKDFEGGYLMTNYLINKGHRKIAFLADEDEVVGVDKARLDGYKTALKEHGIVFHKNVMSSMMWQMWNSPFHKITLLYIVFGLPMNTFLYTGYIKSIPEALDEAACIDGASPFQTFLIVMFPTLKPMTATVAILSVMWTWNDFLMPLVLLSDQKQQTLQLSQYVFQGQFNTQYNLAFASYLLVLLPVLVFYIICQKWIISGVVAGSVKQ